MKSCLPAVYQRPRNTLRDMNIVPLAENPIKKMKSAVFTQALLERSQEKAYSQMGHGSFMRRTLCCVIPPPAARQGETNASS